MPRYDIDKKPNTSGRFILEDGSELNIAEAIRDIESKSNNEPIYLGKINYTEFTAGGTVTKYFPKVLNRNVIRRALIIFSSLDVYVTQQRINMNDSFLSETSRTAGSTSTTSSNVANNYCVQVIDGSKMQLNGEMGEMLNAPVDSFSMSFTIGDSAPIRGEVEIAVMEVLR